MILKQYRNSSRASEYEKNDQNSQNQGCTQPYHLKFFPIDLFPTFLVRTLLIFLPSHDVMTKFPLLSLRVSLILDYQPDFGP